MTPVTVCGSALDVDEAPAGLKKRPTQYCLPSLMNLAILELHAISQVSKHPQLQLRVGGASSAGEEQILEILVDTKVR